MLQLIIIGAVLQSSFAQQYQQKVAPGVPPQQYQNYQPPPPPQQQQMQPPQQQQQYQQPPQQQYQQPPQQQYQNQVPVQQMPVQQVPVPQGGQPSHGHGDPQLLNPTNIEHEREHIQEHMEVPIDTSKMSQSELQFHYFKMHDADHNNKLDGCELIKSLIHWHGEREALVFTDEELEYVVGTLLSVVDGDNDGTIDWFEFKTRTQNGTVPINLEGTRLQPLAEKD